VVKHSQARNVHIQVDRSVGLLRCSIRDDGAGFDVPAVLARRVTVVWGCGAYRNDLTRWGAG